MDAMRMMVVEDNLLANGRTAKPLTAGTANELIQTARSSNDTSIDRVVMVLRSKVIWGLVPFDFNRI